MNINDIPLITARFFRRYHLVLFMVVVVGSMSLVLFLVNQSLQKSTEPSSQTTVQKTTFDQTTIERVQNLQPSSSSDQLSLPVGQRTNPFVE